MATILKTESHDEKKMQHHVKRFRKLGKPSFVLEKYKDRGKHMSNQELKRHICHVASWVSLLDTPDAESYIGSDMLSPVRVLIQMLDYRGQKALTTRLRTVLTRVATRVRQVLAGGVAEYQDDWLELWRALPRRLTQNKDTQKPVETEEGVQRVHGAATGLQHCNVNQDLVVETLKEVRHKQKLVLVRADALIGDAKREEIESVLQKVCSAQQEDDCETIVQRIVEVTGLLSPPRDITMGQSLTSISQQAKEELRAAKQMFLRSTLLQLLERLDLQDSGTRKLLFIPFSRLHQLLCGRQIGQLADSSQWLAIGQAICSCKAGSDDFNEKGGFVGSSLKSNKDLSCKKWKAAAASAAAAALSEKPKCQCVSVESSLHVDEMGEMSATPMSLKRKFDDGQAENGQTNGHARNTRRPILIRAMRDLGGQATAAEVLEHIACQSALVEAVGGLSKLRANIYTSLYRISRKTGMKRHGEPVLALSEETLPRNVQKAKDGYRAEMQFRGAGRRRRHRCLGPTRTALQQAAKDAKQLKTWRATLPAEEMIKRIKAWPGAKFLKTVILGSCDLS